MSKLQADTLSPRRAMGRVGSDDVFDDLKSNLVSGGLRPGAKLKPTEIVKAYGCSANTVRDALLRLSAIGLVEFEMQRGFRATSASPARRSDVTRFRLLLEQAGTSTSMARGGVAWEAQLSAAHHKLRHIEGQIALASDAEPFLQLWTDAEREFHETLISECGSELLFTTYSNVYLQFRQQIVDQHRDIGSSYFETIIAEHQAIVDAALARDENACMVAIRDHLKRNMLDDDMPIEMSIATR